MALPSQASEPVSVTETAEKTGNVLLDALPPAEYRALTARLRKVELPFRSRLVRADEVLVSAFFPTSGVVSLVTLTRSGRTVEANQIGREGIVGLPAFLGVDTMPLEAVVQMPGEALAIPIADLKHVSSAESSLSAVLKRYTYARLVESAQNSACHRLHSLEQRTVRWLLDTDDRVPGNELDMTHDFLAMLLGVQRPRLSEVVARLRRKGLVSYKRGRIRLVDRDGLRAASCDCYFVVRDELRALVTAATS